MTNIEHVLPTVSVEKLQDTCMLIAKKLTKRERASLIRALRGVS